MHGLACFQWKLTDEQTQEKGIDWFFKRKYEEIYETRYSLIRASAVSLNLLLLLSASLQVGLACVPRILQGNKVCFLLYFIDLRHDKFHETYHLCL